MEEGGGVTENRGRSNDIMHLHTKQNSLKAIKAKLPGAPEAIASKSARWFEIEGGKK